MPALVWMLLTVISLWLIALGLEPLVARTRGQASPQLRTQLTGALWTD